MKCPASKWLVLAGACTVLSPTWASPPAVPHAASAASASEPDRRLPTPLEQRERSDDVPTQRLRIEGPVQPQIKLPLGRHLAPADRRVTSTTKDGRERTTGATGGVDDAAARCDAQSSADSRAACRAGLRHPTPR